MLGKGAMQDGADHRFPTREISCKIRMYEASRSQKKVLLSASSTAQGGGGSFKNRKPIGEVGCCEPRMAERIHWWTKGWLKLCFLEWLQWLQWSPHPQLLDEVLCSAIVVVVVWCSGVVVVMCNMWYMCGVVGVAVVVVVVVWCN